MAHIHVLHHNQVFLVLHFIMIAAAYGGAVFNVETYGAVGDVVKDSSEAFARAWAAACKAPSATLMVLKSKTFVVNNLVLQGPCAAGLKLLVDGTILAPSNPGSWNNRRIWLLFQKLQHFTLTGSGTINGRGNMWWRQCQKNTNDLNKEYCKDPNRPTAIHFNDCNAVVISGLSLVNSPLFHLVFHNCDDVNVLSCRITAPGDSPNTDGIDISVSKNIIISDCVIGTGDDCIAIGTGTSDITIKNLKCGPGHGISIGSLGKGNSRTEVNNVTLNGGTLTSTQNGVRIKTWQTSVVKISNVRFNNIHGTSTSQVANNIECSKSIPCTGITLSDISLTLDSGAKASASYENAEGSTIGSSNPSSCLL